MSLPLFIARRMYGNSSHDDTERVSRPAVTIAMIGIAVGLVVMMLSIAISLGFKQEIRNKIVGFGAHIQVANFSRTDVYEMRPIVGSDSIVQLICQASPGVQHIQRFAIKPGMLKTDDDFQGIILKGIGQEYDTTFLANHLIEGVIPLFTDTASSGQVLISKQVADKMGVHVGDRINTYYIEQNVRARRFTVSGIFQTNFAEYDDRFFITDIYTASRLNNWKDADWVSGLEIRISPDASLEQCADEVGAFINSQTDRYGNAYLAQSIDQLYPSIFAWLEVLNTNVVVILVLMLGVAGFTMISGLLILILERTNMIGLLKALGATDQIIRRTFLYFSSFLILKGLFWGNLVGIILCLVQKYAGIIRLDPQTYYVEVVPIQLDIPLLLLLNVLTLAVSVFMLVGPSLLISRIKPAKAIRFE
ncbi:MAG: ABC transporter permease [Bacteroidaceae bacterium]|nr:ABC transporter permease [Bacteroidaceae bacterium]